jgi:hypothetical protein
LVGILDSTTVLRDILQLIILYILANLNQQLQKRLQLRRKRLRSYPLKEWRPAKKELKPDFMMRKKSVTNAVNYFNSQVLPGLYIGHADGAVNICRSRL